MLVKIYYGIFRLKKSDLTWRAINELTRNQLVYFFLVLLTVGFIFANLTNQTSSNELASNISKTVLANLITSGFDVTPPETLVEDSAVAGAARTAGQEKYLDNSILNKQNSLATNENLENNNLPIFNDDGDLIFKQLITPGSSLLENNQNNTDNQNNTSPQRNSLVYYTVQDGDTVSTISRRFNISVNTILWANNLTAYGLIRPGDILTILPYSGVLYTVHSGDTVTQLANKYGVDAKQILSYNDLSSGLKIGQKIVIPGGRPISQATTVAVSKPASSYTGLSAIQDFIKTPSPSPAAKSSGMVWPTAGHNITQYFSWHHPALDIANHIGTPIYAAADGVVLIAQGGWNGGYGNTVLLDNGNNMRTRYGHASKLLVSPGDTVKKGQVIALMGSTGNSTGPHLHFEVLVSGVHYNPLNYVR